MKINYLFTALVLVFSFTSCEKDDDEQVAPAATVNNSGTNNGSNNVQRISNNTVKAGDDTTSVSTAFVSNLKDNNAGGEYYYSIQLSNGSNSDGMLTFMKVIPTASQTFNYTTKTGATMADNEFNISNMKVNGDTWYSVLTTSQAATVDVEVNGNKITFSFVDILLSDAFLNSNVTESKKCSSTFSLSLSELQAVPKDGGANVSLIN